MKTVLCWLAAVMLALFLLPSAYAQEKTFANEALDQAARDYENYLKTEWSTAGAEVRGWIAKGNASLNKSEFRQATGSFAAAAVLEGDNAEAWEGLARAYLGIQTSDYKERQSFPRSASSAAYLAYMRGKTPAQKAAALVLLSDALVRRGEWRPALEALKAALSLQTSPGEAQTIKANFDKLRAEHGFRYLDYSVDNEAASPRLCLQFSETLSPRETDFSKFVTLNGNAAPPVKVERRQLCLEDLTHGSRYEVKVRSGMPSVIEDEPLAKPLELTVYVRDRKPAVHFTGRNYVLPRTGQQGLPVVTINTSRVDVDIFRVGDRRLAVEVLEGEFGSSLAPYALNQIKDEHGEKLWSGSMPVKPNMNEEVTTAFPVDELLPGLKPGLYLMAATPADGSESSRETVTQWFVVSDLGVTAMSGKDGINGFVRSLATGKALAGIEVRLVARNNEILGTAKTNAGGHVLFEAGLTRGTAGQAPALLVARGQDSDYAFLDLTKSAFDLSDRGVGGRQAPGALDAMLFSERGVYRAGETVQLTALVRDQAAMAASVPLTLKVARPDGVEFRREVLAEHADGGRSFALALPQEAMTGTWRVSAYADPKGASIGETSFLVEDYTPERLEMTAEAQVKVIAVGEPAAIAVKGRYLYGAAAAGLALDGEVVVLPSPSGLPGYPGYHFGRDADDFAPVRQPLANLPVMGADGEATVSVSLPALPETSQPLEARTLIRLREASGRFIEKGVVLPVKPRQTGIGIKPLFEGGHVKDGDPAGFEVIAVDAGGKPVALSHMKWELFKLETRFQWYNRNGRWDYQSVDYVRKMANGVLDVDGAAPAKLSVPVSYGAYRLEVTADGQPAVTSSLRFNSGWYVSADADTPDILEVALDKASYKPGDAVKVTVLPRMAGEAMVAVVSDRLIETKTVPVTDKGGEASFTVGKDWGPGAYIMAVAYRPMDEKARRMPSRAVGVKWLPLDAKERTLAVELKPAGKILPNQKMLLPVSLSGVKPGETAHVTVAAVDVGILNVTNYKVPKPEDHYFGQRRLASELRDLYGRLIDGMQGTRGAIRSGGDGIAMRGRPLTTEPVALYSGVVEVPAGGMVEIPFDVPAFDGTLRLMAVAWTGGSVGHAVKDVIVRDAVILSATPPRFLTLGDTSEMHVGLHNVEGAAGSYELAVTAEGGLTAPANAEKRRIRAEGRRADEPGRAVERGEARDRQDFAGLERPGRI